MTKLAIVEEREVDKYEWTKTPKCWLCDPTTGKEIYEASGNPKVCDNLRSLIEVLRQLLGYRTRRRCNAIHDFWSTIRSEGMGRRNPAL